MGTMVAPISSLTAVANEFREELAITKRVLDRVPGDKLAWKPHEKSMSLGQLAWHVATVPGGLGHILQQDSFDVTQGSFVPPCPKTLEEVLAAFDQSARDGEQFLNGLSEEKASANWHLMESHRSYFRGRASRSCAPSC